MMFNQRPKILPTYVSGEEFAVLLHVTQKQHHKLAFILAWGSGLRISEVLNLEPRDFDFSRGLINVRLGKGSKDRYVPIPPHFRPDHLQFFPIRCTFRLKDFLAKHGLRGESDEEVIWRLLGLKTITKEMKGEVKHAYADSL